jgi:hypothetical protein
MIQAVPERVGLVQVVTSNGTVVEITSANRDAIVAQLRRQEMSNPELSFSSALRAFEQAGESGHIGLDRRDEANVIDTINALAERVGGASHLDPGVANLHRTLVKELLAAWKAGSAEGSNPVEAALRARELYEQEQ